MKPVDVLAIGAHPDDIDIGCGGLLIKFATNHRRTAAVDLTAGERGSRGDAERRRMEARTAAERLGLRWRRCLELPDTALDDDAASRCRVVEVLRAARPDLLIGPSRADVHPDHRAAAALVASAWFLAGLERYEPGLGPPHRAPRRLEMVARPGTTPGLLVPIDGVWAAKRDALASHSSQMAPGAGHRLGDPDPMREAETLARGFGLLAGCAYAEGFDAPGGWVLSEPFP